MTITYSLDISSSTFLGIHRLLLRWRGSIWKSILPELVCWLIAYFTLSFTYRYVMEEAQKRYFEQLCKFFGDYIEYIPITFMLGFYVSAVFGRWNQIFDNLGWIDSPALLIATYVRGTDEEARRIRRNIVRYLILTQAMVYRDISSCVQKRFPTMDHLVTAGIMTASELKEFDAVPSANIKYWTPIQWAFLLLQRAKDKKMLESDIIYTDMLEKIRQFRVNVLTLTLYDWVPIPLVYTQVVNLAVRSYFIVALLGRQYMIQNVEENNIHKTIPDLYVPIMTILQFLFYIGWIKVAEVLLNPLGEDDDDFETNWIIDRNLQVGLSIVDDCYGRVPELERDVFWEEAVPEPLYTPESAARPHNPMVGSCNDVSGQEDALLIQPRRRRLMSTMMAYDNAGFLKNIGASTIIRDVPITEDGTEIVPVENHNPARRMSVSATPFSESAGHGRIFESVRRKFSRAPNSRRDSISSAHEFERTMNGRLASGDDISRRPTPRGSFGSTSQQFHHVGVGGYGSPADFTQSLGVSAPYQQQQQAHRSPRVSDVGLIQSERLNHSSSFNFVPLTDDFEKSRDEEDLSGFSKSQSPIDRPYSAGTGNANIWNINESMLPVIEEVRERLRRNARDTESARSSASNSIASSAASSRRASEKDAHDGIAGPAKIFSSITRRNFDSVENDDNEIITTLGDDVVDNVIIASNSSVGSNKNPKNRDDGTNSTTDLRNENQCYDDDEPSPFSQSPTPGVRNSEPDQKYKKDAEKDGTPARSSIWRTPISKKVCSSPITTRSTCGHSEELREGIVDHDDAKFNGESSNNVLMAEIPRRKSPIVGERNGSPRPSFHSLKFAAEEENPKSGILALNDNNSLRKNKETVAEKNIKDKRLNSFSPSKNISLSLASIQNENKREEELQYEPQENQGA